MTTVIYMIAPDKLNAVNFQWTNEEAVKLLDTGELAIQEEGSEKLKITSPSRSV